MQASRDTGGSPSSHIDFKQPLSASANVALPLNPPTPQPGQVSCAPKPGQSPADECGSFASPSFFAPVSEQVSSAMVARISGARLFVARYMLIVSTQT